MIFGGSFYAQPHVEEVCRRSGAWGARRVGMINLLYSIAHGRPNEICQQADGRPARE
ncbi:MAG: hypothetical protein K2N73_08880 [Lachnospiraceae bacterium]|nr:hypothetical protein [Lachnospiraceae bacterium]